MSGDIVARLREYAKDWRDRAASADLVNEAADQIELLTEALKPSGDTKAAYHGEFSLPITTINEDGDEVTYHHPVPWTTIKEIMAAILARTTLSNIRGHNGE